jgi:hypothetical protein
MRSEGQTKLLICFGGPRGLSRAVANAYSQDNYTCWYISRKDRQQANSIYIDIDDKDSVGLAFQSIRKLIENLLPSVVHVHYFTGGALGYNMDIVDEEVLSKIAWHNLVFPIMACERIIEIVAKRQHAIHLHNTFYLTAATNHLNAHPGYVGSKLGLEAYMKHSVKRRLSHTYFCAYKLGMVDIDYKYFHRLKLDKPKDFSKILESQVPSLHFPSAEEIGIFVASCNRSFKLTNGMICDISGGNSWS